MTRLEDIKARLEENYVDYVWELEEKDERESLMPAHEYKDIYLLGVIAALIARVEELEKHIIGEEDKGQ